jgi:hypothetical protein
MEGKIYFFTRMKPNTRRANGIFKGSLFNHKNICLKNMSAIALKKTAIAILQRETKPNTSVRSISDS